MKIRNKITLIFTLLTGSLLIVVFLFIYYFSYRYMKNEFYQRLGERVNILAQSYLEKDEQKVDVYDEVRKKHLQVLPFENKFFSEVDLKRQKVETKVPENYPSGLIKNIFENKFAHREVKGVYYRGIIYNDNAGDFIIIVSAKNLFGVGKLQNLRSILVIGFFFGLIIIFFLGRFYSGKVLQPISAITDKAEDISVSNLHLRLETGKSKDELDVLAHTFNNMLDRLETSFENQTNFINNASHELKNPLTVILGVSELTLNKDRSLDQYKSSLLAINKEANRLESLIKSLLELAQAGSDTGLERKEIRIDELVLAVKDKVSLVRPESKMIFKLTELPEDSDRLVFQGNEELLETAFTNIIDNACKFSSGKDVIISIAFQKKSIEVSVADSGIGIPEDEVNNILQPFYRASNVRNIKGFGVGLALASKIIKHHSGKIRIYSEVGRGTEVKVDLAQRA